MSRLSPTRGPPEEAAGGSPGAFDLDFSLCDLPMDIVPPSPKQTKKQQPPEGLTSGVARKDKQARHIVDLQESIKK